MKQIVRTRRWSRRSDLAIVIASTLGLSHVALAANVQTPTTPPSLATARTAMGFHPIVGKEMVFELSSKGSAGVNLEALVSHVSPQGKPVRGKLEQHSFDVTATLGLRALAQEGDDWLFAGRIAAPRYLVDGHADARASALEVGFLVRYSARGEIKSLEFPVKYPEEAVVAIRALVEPMQVVFAGQGNAWTVGEKSLSGSATVDYAVTGVDAAGVHLSRSVTAARRSLPGMMATEDRIRFNTRVDSSTGTIDWALDGSGPTKITLQEKTTSITSGQEVAKSDTAFVATRVNRALPGLSGTLSDARQQLRDPKYARASFYTVPQSLEKQVDGVDWPTALAFYMEKVNTQKSDVTLLMKFYLRKHPENVDAFVQALNAASDAPEITDALADVVGYGFAAIAAAGHTEAQRALVKVLEGGEYTPLAKQKALDAMLSLEMPERFIPAAVWGYREKLPRTTDGWWETLSIVTNIYGAMGSVNLGVPENTDEVVQTLGRALRNGDTQEKRRALMALGNINDPDRVLPLTTPYFSSSDKALRARAYDTFLNAQGEENFKKFARFYAAERNEEIRDEAGVIALSMGACEAKNAWAEEQARSAKNTIMQSRAVTMLGRALEEYPENEEALRRLLKSVHDREVRKTIYSFVSPTPRGAR